MSHHATNWAIRQRGLKPATKIVLWHLADCHNPAGGCFPTQAWLADACEMSRSTVNLHLDALERLGLISRESEIDPQTKRQRPTRYHLNLADTVSENRTRNEGQAVSEKRTLAVSENETRPVSEKPQKPCPILDESRVRISDTNLVKREPVKEEPVKKETGARDRACAFDAFWAVYPRKVGKDAARKAWASAIKRAGVSEIVAGLRGFVVASKGAEVRFIVHPATWLNQGRWQDDQSHARNGSMSSREDLENLSRISPAEDLANLFRALPMKAITQ